MILFIVSEIMFFFAFFWAFFDASLNPNQSIGGVWPPAFMTVLDAWKIPFLNTVVLLTSGATLTYSHMAIRHGNKRQAYLGLVATLILAVYFTGLQYFEYCNAPFSISDSVYGSVFFLITGFHGIHVMIGSIFIFVSLLRLQADHFSQEHHLGFEFASWYWHFVDVVWIFVFIVIYLWGS
jgi:heme/copper-type cytochrome/quinol oxidase subunit 3